MTVQQTSRNALILRLVVGFGCMYTVWFSPCLAQTRDQVTERFPAVVVVDPRDIYTVNLRVNARVVELADLVPGRRVAAGETLLSFESAELVTLQQSYITNYQNVEAVAAITPRLKETMERNKLTLLWRGLTLEDLETLEAAGTPRKRVPVTAPVDGFISEVNVTLNQIVNAGQAAGQFTAVGFAAVRIARIDSMLIRTFVSPDIASSLSVGRRAYILLDQGQQVEGLIAAIYPIADIQTLKKRVVIDPVEIAAGISLYPGARVLVSFEPLQQLSTE